MEVAENIYGNVVLIKYVEIYIKYMVTIFFTSVVKVIQIRRIIL